MAAARLHDDVTPLDRRPHVRCPCSVVPEHLKQLWRIKSLLARADSTQPRNAVRHAWLVFLDQTYLLCHTKSAVSAHDASGLSRVFAWLRGANGVDSRKQSGELGQQNMHCHDRDVLR